MDSLTYAIMAQLNPPASLTADIKLKTKEYCQNTIEQQKANPGFFFELAVSSPDIYVKFWALGGLEEIVSHHYNEYNAAMRQGLHEFYFQLLEKQPASILCSPYIEAKYATLFCLMLRQDYPQSWPDAFSRLLSLLRLEVTATDLALKIRYISFIMTTLIEFDREIVDYYEMKKQEDCQKSNVIKDEMRKSTVNDIAFLLKQIIDNYSFFKENAAEKVVAQAIEVMEKTVDWASVDLFLANLPTVIQFLGVPALQTPSAKCIYSIIDKGMDAPTKISLFESLSLITILAQWDPTVPGRDEEFQKSMATVVNKIGSFLLEWLSPAAKLDATAISWVENKLPTVISMAMKYLDQGYPSVSIIISPFLSQYLTLLKKISLQPFHMQSAHELLEIIVKRIQCPAVYFQGTAMDEEFVSLRNELTTLFVNLAGIPSIQAGVVSYVEKLLDTLKTSYKELLPQQKEVILYLFYRHGQALKDAQQQSLAKTEAPKMMEVVLAIPEVFTDHFLVLSAALDVVVRYAGYFETHEDKCAEILGFFVSDKGIFSKDSPTANKAAEEYFKFMERLKHKPCLVKNYPTILTQASAAIKLAMQGRTQLTQAGIQSLYQCLGLIVAYKPIGTAARSAVLQEHINLQLAFLKSPGANAKVTNLAARNISLLLRSFESEVEDELKGMIKGLAQTALDILKRNPGDFAIRETVLSLFHKLVMMVGVGLTPVIKEFINLILQNYDMTVIAAVIRITSMIVHTWKRQGLPFVKEVFGFLLKSIIEVGCPVNKVSDIEKTQLELIASYLKMLKALFVIDVAILFEQPLEQFSAFFDYLLKLVQYDTDDLIKRLAVVLFGMVLAGGIGINLGSENLVLIIAMQPSKTTKMPLLLPEFNMQTREFLGKAQDAAVISLLHVNLSNPNDVQTLSDIAALHCLLNRTDGPEFHKKLEQYFGAAIANLKAGLGLMHEKSSTKEYKELLKAIVSSRTATQ